MKGFFQQNSFVQVLLFALVLAQYLVHLLSPVYLCLPLVHFHHSVNPQVVAAEISCQHFDFALVVVVEPGFLRTF